MPEKIIIIYKKKGQTPLDAIHEARSHNSELGLLPMTYAGRLDPLAEGVLLLLVGDECNKKDEYLKLAKVYEVEILFGFATDTYDVMGKIMEVKNTEELFDFSRPGSSSSLIRGPEKLNNSEVLDEALFKFTGRIKQSYPPFSSRTVNGKPLFVWAREGKLDEIEIPSHDVFVESIDIIEESSITSEKLLEKIKNDISLVKGDFRQDEIIKLWEENLENKKEGIYKTIKLRISCGSGVYVRVLANDIGEALGIPALALDIRRVSVGEYKLIAE